MGVYACRVVDLRGRTSSFLREAESEEVLLRDLNRESLSPLAIRAASTSEAAAPARRRYSRAAVLEFTDSVGMLLASGLTFKDALEVAQGIFAKGEIGDLVKYLLAQIRKGASIVDAVAGLGPGLPPVYRGFLRIGERTGSLEDAFRQLASYLGEDRKLRAKISGSLAYPALVLGVAIVGIAAIVAFVLPRISLLFEQLGTALPARLGAMLAVVRAGGIAVGAIAVAAALAAIVLAVARRSNPRLAEALDRAVLRVPLIGRMRFLREMLNLLFALEMLSAGGFTVEDALAQAGEVVGNRAFRAALTRVREAIVRGDNLSAAFLADPVFTSRVGHWIAVGERIGQVEQVFGQLRRHFQAEMEKWSTRFMSLVEPAIILVVGVVIFFVIVVVVMPIFSIYEGLG
jgi:type II secretory pathway component PulF